jgi:hypothetical protein
LVDIRLSHLLRDCSVGAIVRHDKVLMVVQDTRDWDGPNTSPHERELKYVSLVKRSLGLGDTKLCRPPVKEQKGERVQGWVPARLFPEWVRCSRCGLLHSKPWRTRNEDPMAGRESDVVLTDRQPEVLHCRGVVSATGGTSGRGASDKEGRCGGLLEQVPWVLIHEDGYLADVPWHAIAHASTRNPEQRDCRPDWSEPYLRVESREGRWWVRCSRRGCGAEQRLPDRFPFGAGTRQQPWVLEPPPEAPGEPGWLVGVNDVRVHYAECRTALVIPPESRIRRGSVVDRLYGSSADQHSIRAARTETARRSRLQGLARKYRCSVADIEAALEGIARGYPLHDLELPQGDLAHLEFGALTELIPDLRSDEDFVTEHYSAAWQRLDVDPEGSSAGFVAAVDRLVAVHRVKEIMVFDGFRRGWGSGEERRPVTPPDVVGESDWLPALELWGEGLFFSLCEDAVRCWEHQDAALKRTEAFVERSVEARLPRDVQAAISPRFLLCHTLAHLIIRRLEAQAGYPAASLKERIYCDDGQGDDEPMAGLLIYVAVADEHGSLGGLMDTARPDRFLRLLAGAVEDAAWCSFDPVCAEQEGHGPDLLNRAACHACALVPEPSCVCGNRLLDRAFVTGDGASLRPLWELASSEGSRRHAV